MAINCHNDIGLPAASFWTAYHQTANQLYRLRGLANAVYEVFEDSPAIDHKGHDTSALTVVIDCLVEAAMEVQRIHEAEWQAYKADKEKVSA